MENDASVLELRGSKKCELQQLYDYIFEKIKTPMSHLLKKNDKMKSAAA